MRIKHVTNEVAHIWAHQTYAKHGAAENNARHGNLYFDGDTIYSYGAHFPIARHVIAKDGKPTILFTTRSYSVTTAGHIREVRGAIPHGVRVLNVERPDQTPDSAVLDSIQVEIDAANIEARNYRAKVGARHAALQLEGLVARANAISQAFKLRRKFKVPADWAAVRAEGDRLAEEHGAKVEARRAQEAARHAARNAAQIATFDAVYAAWKADGTLPEELPDLPWSARGDREVQIEELGAAKNAVELDAWKAGTSNDISFLGYGGKAYLRLNPADPAVVETTKRASVPTAHVVRALPLVLGIIRAGKTWATNGHTIHIGAYKLDEIEADGTVRAGCHTFTRAEIERFAEVLGVK
ncbi:MAG: hypothetical protein WCS70_06840 [Verrucomicrobiota bacterium]